MSPNHPYRGADLYQDRARQTLQSDLSTLDTKAACALGVAGEAGEVADYLKKVLYYHQPFDREKIKKELGDVLWYVAVLSELFGLKLSEVMAANIEKLRMRYPNGFTTEDSIQRADGEVNDQDEECK